MGSLKYSTPAVVTLPKFHRRKYVIYVEGQDDVVFWAAVLRFAKIENFHLKIAGGKTEIEKYSNDIIANNAGIFVARDRDYSDFDGSLRKHTRIFYTYGYSIENTIYSSQSISRAIESHSRTPGNYEKSVERWMNGFLNKHLRLIEFDLANEIFSKGCSVLGSSCSRFLKSPTSHQPDQIKIRATCKLLRSNISQAERRAARNKINSCKKHLRYIIRGHFLTNAVSNLIKNEVLRIGGRKIHLSHESMFVFFLERFIRNSDKADLKYLKRQVRAVK